MATLPTEQPVAPLRQRMLDDMASLAAFRPRWILFRNGADKFDCHILAIRYTEAGAVLLTIAR